MKSRTLRRVGPIVAAALMTLMALTCLALAVATVALVGGAPGLAGAVLVALAAFEVLRIRVGGAAGRLIDG